MANSRLHANGTHINKCCEYKRGLRSLCTKHEHCSLTIVQILVIIVGFLKYPSCLLQKVDWMCNKLLLYS